MGAKALALCPGMCHPEVCEQRSLAALAALPRGPDCLCQVYFPQTQDLNATA